MVYIFDNWKAYCSKIEDQRQHDEAVSIIFENTPTQI